VPFDPERVGTHHDVLALAALANGRLPMRRVAEFESRATTSARDGIEAERLSARRRRNSSAGQGEHDRHERGREKIYRSNAFEAHPV